MKTFLVVNPKSAGGDTGRRWTQLAAGVGRVVGEFGHAFTERPMHAADLTRQALQSGFDCVVAVGGDGTLNEVVNGFFEDGAPVRPGAALGLIPQGTGGDFRRTFRWGLSLEESLERLKTERTEPLDAGLLEFQDADGKPARRYFVNICSFGASGQADKRVNSTTKAFGGKISFLVGTVRALAGYRDQKVRVRLDDAEPEDLEVTTLSVANGKYFGSGMCVAPDAITSDGWFDVTIWSGYGLADFALKSHAVYSGAHVRWSGTRQLRCKVLSAESDEEVLLDVDGEQPGRLPCKMTLLPGALRLKI